MTEQFRSVLDAFVRGDLQWVDLDAALRSVLTQHPEAAPELLTLLHARYRAGQMPDEVFSALDARLSSISVARRGQVDDKTRVRTEPAGVEADDGTRLPESRPTDTLVAPVSRPPAGDGLSTGPTSPSGAPSGTGASWGDSAQWANGPSEPPRVGMTLKNRFVLESVLGRGGMGVVFKARDQRKEEAQDRNPYVAVKVLNEEFKRHPESLKALQRESRKAQNLAHPNIVTVYDFDRDGDTVYMTMEYLDGEPLDRFIKRDNPRGMPLKEVLPVIDGIGRALAYAHQKGVVHSDFKPGNVFLTRDGGVKVFDFGIAQATKQAGTSAGDQTLFDAGTLGALTPSYASVEMLEGGEPDPRDDIYALACVTYQLLTGRHPFDRRPATEARDAKLSPRPVAGLSRRAWRALLQGLAFDRTARCPDVESFLAGLRPVKRSRIAVIGGSVAVLAMGILIASVLPGYLQQRRIAETVSKIDQGDAAQIAAALKTVKTLGPQARASVIQQVRNRILAYYHQEVDQLFSPAKGRYNYPSAERVLKQAHDLFPDSAQVQDLANRTLSARNQLLNSLNARFNKALSAGHLLPRPDKDDIADILDTVAQLDPTDQMLVDPRLAIAYAQQAAQAAATKNSSEALALVDAGLGRFPANTSLINLQDKVRRQLHFQQVQGQIDHTETKIRAVLDQLRTVSDIGRLRKSVLELSVLYPEDPLLNRVQSSLQSLIGHVFAGLVAKQDWHQARQLLANTGDLLDIDFTRGLVRQLPSAEQPSAQRAQTQVRQAEAQVTTLVAKPVFTRDWRAGLEHNMRSLAGLLASPNSWFAQTRRQIAEIYLQRVRELSNAQRFDEATEMLRAGEQFAALSTFEQMRTTLALAKTKMEAQAREEQRQAQVASQKQTFLIEATANDIAGARRTLTVLQKELSANDPFLVQAAPRALGEAYLRMAKQQAAEHHYSDAVALIRAGKKEAPKLTKLDDVLKRYRPEAEMEGIEKSLHSGTPQALVALKERLHEFRAAHPKEYARDSSLLPDIAVRRVLNLAKSNTALAGELLAVDRELFPGNQELMAIRFTASAPAEPAQQTSMAPAGRPCSPNLAGYGRSIRGTCYDQIGPGERGPALAVIPAGDGIATPYAITKYEISVGEYDQYCTLSKRCKGLPGESKDLPATDISYKSAQAYAAWLSVRTGFRYAIPTNRQWTHAAKADGDESIGDYNCRVHIDGKLIKGFGLIDVKTGQANRWGLVNYVGNAQEWVQSNKGLEVRGGSYQDSLSQCSVALTRPSSGKPNKATGFRLMRALQPLH